MCKFYASLSFNAYMAIMLSVGIAACGNAQSSSTHSADLTSSSPAALYSGFLNPPLDAKLRCYWWWLNGNTDKATITNDLEEMKAKGYGGALLVDANGADQGGNHHVPAGPMFGTPAWVDLYQWTLSEADRLGLEITLNITSGWNLGGPYVTPDQASKIITYSSVQFTGGKHIHSQLPSPPAKNNYYRRIAVLAYPLSHGVDLAPQIDKQQAVSNPSLSNQEFIHILRARSAAAETGMSMPDSSWMLKDGVHEENAPFAGDPSYSDATFASIQDISSHVTEDGELDWNAPEGTWEVLNIGYTDSDAKVSTSSGDWQGLAIDYMSRDAFKKAWDASVKPLLIIAKEHPSLKYLATDSWEIGGTNWTQEFRQKFQALRGYDPVPWLPVVSGRIIDNRDASTRFLSDLRRTVADLVASEHYDVFAEKAKEYGLGVQAESGGPHGAPIDALETFRHSAVPQSEFWAPNAHRSTDPERFFTKEAASAANIYGKHFVAQEGETSIGPQWSESLAADLKPAFDRAITEGMNRLVWHEFTSSPANTGLPGQEYFAGTHLNPKVTWWNAGKAFFDYIDRVQFLMQQGTPVDDVLYYYGDNVPAFVRLKADDPAHVLPNYDYDVTNEDALLHTIRIDKDKLVGPGGVQWKLLMMPATRRASLAVLKVVDKYLQSGGAVAGLPPQSPTGQVTKDELDQFEILVRKIWQNCKADSFHSYGFGTVYCFSNAHFALEQMHVQPDFYVIADKASEISSTSETKLDYVHRRVGATDIYFLRNSASTAVHFQAIFRADGRHAEIWNPVSATAYQADAKPSKGGRMTVSLELPSYGSTFVLFHNASTSAQDQISVLQKEEDVKALSGWTLAFQPDRGAPTGLIPVNAFQSWTEFSDPRIRYFSGTATYHATVQRPSAPKGAKILLHLEGLREIAQIRVNGKDAGTIWAAPYTLRIDNLLHEGKNDLEIAVTNLWPNRIIGDKQPDATTHYTQTNITTYSADSPLLPSGLLQSPKWMIQ